MVWPIMLEQVTGLAYVRALRVKAQMECAKLGRSSYGPREAVFPQRGIALRHGFVHRVRHTAIGEARGSGAKLADVDRLRQLRTAHSSSFFSFACRFGRFSNVVLVEGRDHDSDAASLWQSNHVRNIRHLGACACMGGCRNTRTAAGDAAGE